MAVAGDWSEGPPETRMSPKSSYEDQGTGLGTAALELLKAPFEAAGSLFSSLGEGDPEKGAGAIAEIAAAIMGTQPTDRKNFTLERSTVQAGVTWMLPVLAIGVLGLAAYLLIRRKR